MSLGISNPCDFSYLKLNVAFLLCNFHFLYLPFPKPEKSLDFSNPCDIYFLKIFYIRLVDGGVILIKWIYKIFSEVIIFYFD